MGNHAGVGTTWKTRVDIRWHALVEAFLRSADGPFEPSFAEPSFAADGSWVVVAELGSTYGELLKSCPVKLEPCRRTTESLIDQHGNDVDQESWTSVECNPVERVIVTWSSHREAGDSGQLGVYASEEAYRRALEVACAEQSEYEE